jgi:hypothetical protein
MSEQAEVPVEETAGPERPGDTTYVVQVARGSLAAVEEGREVTVDEAWQDIATVTVPRKSPRKKVIGLALAQSGIRPATDSEPLRVRVLDAASAAETVVAAVQAEPEWRVG